LIGAENPKKITRKLKKPTTFELYFNTTYNLLNYISAEKLFEMEFPVISCNKIYKSKKITYSYDSTDEKIIETIKKNSMIPPLSYIERCIENLMEHEEDKRPLVNIPNFGAVGFKNLNNMINLHTAIQLKDDLTDLVNWTSKKNLELKFEPSLIKKLIIKTKGIYTPFRNNLNLKISDLCTLARDNYLNDTVLETAMRIFSDYIKKSSQESQEYIIAPIYTFQYIRNKNYEIPNKFFNKYDFSKVKYIYIILHINNNHWTFVKLALESSAIYYGDSLRDVFYELGIPCQRSPLDCGIIVLNFIGNDIGLSNKFYNKFESKNDNDSKDVKIQLTLSTTWKTLEYATSDIRDFGIYNGFVASIVSTKPHAKYFKCHHSGFQRAGRKNLDPTKNLKKSSKKTNCPWQININYPKSKSYVHITKFINFHNHVITEDDKKLHASKNIAPYIRSEIITYAKQNIEQQKIKNILYERYPNFYIDDKKLDNIIQSTRKPSISRRLTRIIWMSPIQRENWNIFRINNEGKSILLSQALIEHENIETFNWIFESLKSIYLKEPKTIMSDHDLSLEKSIKLNYPSSLHYLCLYHIYNNLKRNIRPLIHDNYNNFIKDFNRLLESFSVEIFENFWTILINKHHNNNKKYVDYLTKNLYNVKEKWAWPWKYNIMMAGVKTTSRLEETYSLNSWYRSKNDLHGSKSYMNVYDDILANSDEYLSSFSQSRLKTEILNSFPYNCIPNNFETFINTIDQSNDSNDNDDNINFDTIDIRNISIDRITEHLQLNIVEVWTVKHFLGSKNQYLLVLEDAKFHISLIPSRWYQESKLVDDINNLVENEPLLTSNAKDTHVLPQQFKKSFKENYIKITSYNNLPAIKEENLKLKSSREHYINLHDKFKTLVGCMDNEENYN
ncbi:3960_t:CDS:2, partial [Entrophospora sp. SA101]